MTHNSKSKSHKEFKTSTFEFKHPVDICFSVKFRWHDLWTKSNDLLSNWKLWLGKVFWAGGTRGALFTPPDFGRFRSKTCSIKRPCNTVEGPLKFLDLPPALVDVVKIVGGIALPDVHFGN